MAFPRLDGALGSLRRLLSRGGQAVQTPQVSPNAHNSPAAPAENVNADFPHSPNSINSSAELPADRVLVETDAPYLAPGRHRGKRNEPAFVLETARVLAETRNVTFEEIAGQTTENFFRLFSKVPRQAAAAA